MTNQATTFLFFAYERHRPSHHVEPVTETHTFEVIGPPKLPCLRKKDETHQDAEEMSTDQRPRDAHKRPEEGRSRQLHLRSTPRAWLPPPCAAVTRRRFQKAWKLRPFNRPLTPRSASPTSRLHQKMTWTSRSSGRSFAGGNRIIQSIQHIGGLTEEK